MTKETDSFAEDMWKIYHNFHYYCDKHRFQKMFARVDLYRMVADLPGDIVDAGVYKGTSSILWAHLLETYQPNSRSKVVGFDTFGKSSRTRASMRKRPSRCIRQVMTKPLWPA